MTRPMISTPSSGTRPLGSVESAKVGQRGPHTIKLGVLIDSDPLRKAKLGAKGTAVAGGNRGCKWGSERDPTPRISTFEPRQIPPNPRPRCLDPNSGSVPPSAAHGPIHKPPNDSVNETNPSSELPQSEAQRPSTHHRDLRSQSQTSRPGTRTPGSRSIIERNQDTLLHETGPRTPSPHKTGPGSQHPCPRPWLRPSDPDLTSRFPPDPSP